MSLKGDAEYFAKNRYFERGFDVEAVKVLPGEYYVATTDMVIVTVLGSCVAACIRDRDTGVGGLNHFMLADAGDAVDGESARYGGYAMELLINHLLKSGARRDRLEAKVFGGGQMMSSLSASSVGGRNAQFVLDYLATEKIPVLAQDLLDVCPRKVFFFPVTGKVLVKRLSQLPNDTVASREREYAKRLRNTPVGGEIELFE